ncbi:uncharacterized protein LOC114366508 [Ostrinia furnacalis]|uniref:uncharacterized protein LOC114366508 n=1 Tax=Ostrinia furnacalis TaxID=93504 RepID=UPI00103DBDAC|nr:uncharacterized protein LOC114366508 [Ostrinia furnacalis]
MFLVGVLFLAASALAQPTLYVARGTWWDPFSLIPFRSSPEIAIIKYKEAKEVLVKDTEVIPEGPVLDPLPMLDSVVLEKEDIKEESEEKKDREEIEHESIEELREEVLKEEAPKKEESEEDKKVLVKLVPPPLKLIRLAPNYYDFL